MRGGRGLGGGQIEGGMMAEGQGKGEGVQGRLCTGVAAEGRSHAVHDDATPISSRSHR
jgi:hypothetical protein